MTTSLPSPAPAKEIQPGTSRGTRWRVPSMGLALAALGVVFGDIGTSPLYAMRECFHGVHAVAPTPQNVLGVMSLIFWALMLVISLKYLVFILRADHQGEGGILALAVLALRVRPSAVLATVGLFGAALLYSDGMITPAITVLSAVEGLRVAAPVLGQLVLPVSVAILVLLFVVQSRGTARIGAVFGPVTLLWFLAIALLGIRQIAAEPAVLWALNPLHAARFFVANGWHGFFILGAVFLVVTGGEALYADIGHFGVGPIRFVWFALVLPALVLNYLGQGALLLQRPEAAANLFFELAPQWCLVPLVILAAAAAVIASQALITGAFSLTMQAVQLGYLPRVTVRHTSSETRGQIYVPLANWALMLASIALVLEFESSSSLDAAYGVSITSTMLITTILFYVVARWQWKWGAWVSAGVAGAFLAVDLTFLGANFAKLFHGGWFPLVVALAVFTLMSTWRRGRLRLGAKLQAALLPLESLLEEVGRSAPLRVSGTALFMSGNPAGTPAALLHNWKHNKVLHERIVILHVRTEEVPHVPEHSRGTVEGLSHGFWKVSVRFGFMDEPHVPNALARLSSSEFPFEPGQASYFLGRERVLAPACGDLGGWRESLFAWMSQNARDATSFFSLPPNRVVELGAQIEI